jgi:uncharacterized protein DUF5320
MPRGDGTGPVGMGPMTGRAAGFCAGYSVPGYANSVGGRGMGMGRGFGGGGFGRGRGFGWGRGGYGLPAYGNAVNPYAYGGSPFTPAVAPQQELDSLKGQAEYLEENLEEIKKRIEELEKAKTE